MWEIKEQILKQETFRPLKNSFQTLRENKWELKISFASNSVTNANFTLHGHEINLTRLRVTFEMKR